MKSFFSLAHNKQGTTLVELAIVLAIVAIVGAVVATGYGFISTDRINAASKELFGDLQKIRHAAIAQGADAAVPETKGFGIRFESTRTYRLFRFNDINSNFKYDGSGEEISLQAEATATQREISPPIAIKIKNRSNLVDPRNTVLLFDHLGMPRQANWGFQQKTLVIQNADRDEIPAKCISISFNRIREGQWDGSSCQER